MQNGNASDANVENSEAIPAAATWRFPINAVDTLHFGSEFPEVASVDETDGHIGISFRIFLRLAGPEYPELASMNKFPCAGRS